MIGGMIGNNSCGTYSPYYGSTRDHVIAIDAILADGSEVIFEDVDSDTLALKKSQDDLEGHIYRTVIDQLSQWGVTILDDFPDPSITRRNTGYAIDELIRNHQPFNPNGKPFSLVPILCGSEGTLAITKKAKLNLVPLENTRLMICAHFKSIFDALEIMPSIMQMKPVAVEMIDRHTLECTRGNVKQNRNRFWIEGDPDAVLVIEWFTETESGDVGISEKVSRILELGAYAAASINQDDYSAVRELRKAGLGVLMGEVAYAKAIAVIEDAAVPVDKLASYFEDVQKLMKSLGLDCVYYGHVSVGLIHVRPKLDLREIQDRDLLKKVAEQHAKLIKQYRGSLSGEHGDGRLRAPFILDQVGAKAYQVMSNIKQAFDPLGVLNPGVIFDKPDIPLNLRADRSQLDSLATGFNWERELGILAAVEKCNGAGACRKSSGRGVMCPSYQVTREENFSTRGRSNLLRRALTEIHPLEALVSAQVENALAHCLGCKACKSECPASVDMARLKSEVFYQTRDQRRFTNYAIRLFPSFLKVGGMFPVVINWIQSNGLFKRIAGIDARRSFPKVHHDPMTKLLKKPFKGRGDGRIWILVDVFSRYWSPAVVESAVDVLQSLGFSTELVMMKASPRALISNGLLNEAKDELSRVYKLLDQCMPEDAVIALEPSEALVWRDEALDLIDTSKLGRDLNIQLFEELIVDLAQKGLLPKMRRFDRDVSVHVHCHQKSLTDVSTVSKALSLIDGIKVNILNTGCCGMSGDFGFKHFDMSKKIAEQSIIPSISALDESDLVVASGLSCRHQIEDFTGRPSLHIAQVFHQVVI